MVERGEQVKHLDGIAPVECARRLVCKKHTRLADNGSDYRTPLLFTARALRRKMRFNLVNAHCFKKLLRFFICLCGRYVLVKIRGNNDIFKQRHIADKVHFLKDKAKVLAAQKSKLFFRHLDKVVSVVDNLAGGRPVHTAQSVKKCRFAAARRAHYDREVALVHIKVYPRENVVLHTVCGKGFTELSC